MFDERPFTFDGQDDQSVVDVSFVAREEDDGMLFGHILLGPQFGPFAVGLSFDDQVDAFGSDFAFVPQFYFAVDHLSWMLDHTAQHYTKHFDGHD